jgi:aldehyde dehydrogenase (NAD+)
MAERYRALRVGPALDDLDVGPVISARQREIVQGYLAWRRQQRPAGRRQAPLPASAAAPAAATCRPRWWRPC